MFSSDSPLPPHFYLGHPLFPDDIFIKKGTFARENQLNL